jgi:hypothetical protein
MAGKKTKKLKTKLKLDQLLEDNGCDLEEQGFIRMGPAGKDSWEDDAVVGLTMGEEDERLVYDYDLLVERLAKEILPRVRKERAKDKFIGSSPYKTAEDEAWSRAAEDVDCNTVRGLEYLDDPGKPVLMRRLNR